MEITIKETNERTRCTANLKNKLLPTGYFNSFRAVARVFSVKA